MTERDKQVLCPACGLLVFNDKQGNLRYHISIKTNLICAGTGITAELASQYVSRISCSSCMHSCRVTAGLFCSNIRRLCPESPCDQWVREAGAEG